MAKFSNKLEVIRRRLSSQLGDLIEGTADSGADVTLVDADILREADNYYSKHRYQCYIYEGTNEGEERRVSASGQSATSITLAPAYTSAIDSTSKYELHKIFFEPELRKAINQAIDFSARLPYLLDVRDQTTIRLTSTTDNNGNTNYTNEYTLPTNFFYVHQIPTEKGVSGKKLTGTISGTFTDEETITGSTSGATGIFSYQSATSGSGYILVREVSGTFVVGEDADGASISCATLTAIADETVGYDKWYDQDIIDPRDWDILRQGSATPLLKLDKNHYSITEDLYLRLEGQGIQDVVSDDDDVIYLPPDWLVYKAITFLPIWKLETAKLNDIVATARYMSERIPRSHPYPNSRRVV